MNIIDENIEAMNSIEFNEEAVFKDISNEIRKEELKPVK